MMLPAITVWQPWASLIAIGAKPTEFRGWLPPKHFIGTQIAVHAAGRAIDPDELRELLYKLDRRDTRDNGLNPDLALPLLREALSLPAVLPRGVIVCTAVLGEPKRCSLILPGGDPQKWGWPMGQVRKIEPPVPAKGKQGFWFARLADTAGAA